MFYRETESFYIFLSTGGGSFAILKANIIVGRHRDMKKILFVCHGNICRSPMAEFVMKDLVEKAGLAAQFYVDAVHPVHEGEDPRTSAAG